MWANPVSYTHLEPLTVNLVVGGAIIFLSLLVMEVNPAALLRRRTAE